MLAEEHAGGPQTSLGGVLLPAFDWMFSGDNGYFVSNNRPIAPTRSRGLVGA